MRRVNPVKPYFPEEDIEKIKSLVGSILSSGMISNYKYTQEYEKQFAEICEVKEAVALSSGTAALELVLNCLDVENKEILVPTNTFTATVSAILTAKARPVLTDIAPQTLCIDMKSIESKITQKTFGIMVVHIGGLVCPEMFEIKKFCESNGLVLIEDSSHAQGSLIDGKAAGSFGNAGCFSLYATKIITTAEGGMITTDDKEIADKARMLRDQGKDPSNADRVLELGNSYRFPEISAVLGIMQLQRLKEIIGKRTKTAKFYDEELKKIEGITPLEVPSNMTEGYYKYVAFLKKGISRDLFKQKLRERGVICGSEVYSIPIHMQPIYMRLLGTHEGDFPYSEDVCQRMICLPITTQMTQEDEEYVIKCVKEVMNEV